MRVALTNGVEQGRAMTSVDVRTRHQGDVIALDPTTFLDEHVPALLEAHGPTAGRGPRTGWAWCR